MAQWILIDRKANISNSICVAIANHLGVYYSKNDTCNNNVRNIVLWKNFYRIMTNF